jgi:hypothetical protein
MPDWTIRVILGLFVWFILCYFFITPFIYDRVTIKLRNDYVAKIDLYNQHWKVKDHPVVARIFADCLYANYLDLYSMELTVWVSSIGFYSPVVVKRMEKLVNTNEYLSTCGELPWKTRT